MREWTDVGIKISGVLMIALAASRLCVDLERWAWFVVAMVGWVVVDKSRKVELCQRVILTNEAEEPAAVSSGPQEPASRPVAPVALPPVTPPITATPAASAKVVHPLREDVVSALVNLGVKKKSAEWATDQAIAEKPDGSCEDLFRLAVAKRNG